MCDLRFSSMAAKKHIQRDKRYESGVRMTLHLEDAYFYLSDLLAQCHRLLVLTNE